MALVAALTREPARAEVERLLRSPEDPARMAGPNLAEVVDVLVRVKRFDQARVARALSWLRAGGLEVVPTGEPVAVEAGTLRSTHYHRRDCPISLCDCVAIATASALGDAVATADSALAAVARAQDVEVVPLPNSVGKLPI